MITLTSDFGLNDTYVAQMKGVILTINPRATIIDVTHGIEKFNITTGAFMLASAAPYFPTETTHLAVVDPGVGTKRRAIVVQTKKSYFVGPDNGILMLAAKSQSIESIHEISNPQLMLPKPSNTFHGRDIFAPTAAYLDKGVKPEEFGPEVKDPITPQFLKVEQNKGVLSGEVIYVDSFGNVITNIEEKIMPSSLQVSMKLPRVSFKVKFCETYGQAKNDEPLLLVGSHGFIELAVNQGNAAERYLVNIGDKITVTTA